MKRTGAGILLITAAIGVAAGFLLDQLLTSTGRPTFTPAVTLPILLVLLGAIVVVLARADPPRHARYDAGGGQSVPRAADRHARQGVEHRRRLHGGLAIGLLVFLLTRPVTPSLGSMGTIIATAVCAAILVTAGLVAEHMCIIRKDDDDEQPGGDPGLEPHDHH